MPSISERDLSVFISLLSAKIREMRVELQSAESDTDEPSDEQIDERVELLQALEQYLQIRDTVREEYEAALEQGVNLPSYEALTGDNQDR